MNSSEALVTAVVLGFARGVYYGLIVGAGIVMMVTVVYLVRYVLGCS